jgi:hypothetical protein
MAEGGNEDLADLDAASIHSDASTEILHCEEDTEIPVVDLVTPSTSPDRSVHFVSPASSICINSDGESVSDASTMDELDYYLALASPLNELVEDRIVYPVFLPSTSSSSSCTGSELSLDGATSSEDVDPTHGSDSSLCSDGLK